MLEVSAKGNQETIPRSVPRTREMKSLGFLCNFKSMWFRNITRFFLGSGEVARMGTKTNRQSQPIDLKAERYVPGSCRRSVLEGLSYSEKDIRGCFKGDG